MYIYPISHLNGTMITPPDKSISHRGVMFGSLSKGKTILHHFLTGADCLSTIACFKQLGISISLEKDTVIIDGKGIYGLKSPSAMLDCGNSGTTTRLLTGILAGQTFSSTITGDASIQKRPMQRILEPLIQMGAKINASNREYCPLTIYPSTLNGITYKSKIASAQVKSCILLAGLYASSPTTVTEPFVSRDHTERLLPAFGAQLIQKDTSTTILPCAHLEGTTLTIPGDISSAAFFIVAALILPNSEVLLKNVGLNPTRSGIIDVLLQMGANIEIVNTSTVGNEPVGDLIVRSSNLHGVTIEGAIIPTLIDEIPILAVAACYAEGTTIIKDASELRVKECNRIEALDTQLRKMGADITATSDGLIIKGKSSLHGASLNTYHDHRIAMSLAIATLGASSSSFLDHSDCINISFPNFFTILSDLVR